MKKKDWYSFASDVKNIILKIGHGPGSRFCLMDNIPGPCSLAVRPGQREMQYNELEHLNQTHPEYDWPTIIAQRDVAARPARMKSRTRLH